MARDELVFLPLGGSGEIGMNMNLYGFGPAQKRRWLMIDCGVMFGDLATPGIDVICPDPGYILDEVDQLEALLLTHGHEDHIGAVALIAPMLKCPVYATPFTANLVQNKLNEAGVNIDLRIIEMGARFELGPFDIEYVTLTHSIPEPSAIILRTPLGNVLHTGDWKIAPEPTLGPVTDSPSLRAIGDEGVMTIVCDSTNVSSRGQSGSEMRVKENLIELIAAQENRVAVTTFASNVSRVLSICEAANAADRSVCLLGRSMLRITNAAREVGILPEGISFVEPKDAGYLPKDKVLYLCTGSQGEARAALARIARDDHPELALTDGDTVIFSSKIIPGNEREIFTLQNDLVELGVHIITEKDEFIHVSGHPNREELRQMYEWVRPKYAIPVHGEARHLEEHADFALELGVDASLAPRNGDLIRIAPGAPEVIDEVPAGRWMLDGAFLLPEGASPLRERRKLGYAGVVFVAVAIGGDIDIKIVGAPHETPDGDDIIAELESAALEAIDKLSRQKQSDPDAVEIAVMRAVRNTMQDFWRKRPIVEVSVLRV